jgi:predicted O-methyltransferase YrrM
MSAESTPVSPALFEYLAARTRGSDAFLEGLRQAARTRGFPEIWISSEQASLMQILLKSASARRVLEIGTLVGVSAISMARALPPRTRGGALVTIELDPERVAFAREWVARSDVSDRVEVLQGDARTVLEGLEPATFDAAFLDADKGGYEHYLERCLHLVRPGGLILVDNAFAFGQLLEESASDPDVLAVRRFNDRMAATPGLHGVIVPIGDGLWVAVVEPRA